MVKFSEGATVAVGVVVLLSIPAFLYGWVHNIIDIVHSSFSPLTGLVVLRCIGIFVAPLGAILGYV